MRHHPASPTAMLSLPLRHRGLIVAMARREVLGRYRGSGLGLWWSFVTPLLMLAMYTFVFSVVFKARWGSHGESRSEFAIVLFCGLIVFNFFGECISRAPALVTSNVNFVKKVAFPLEILPVVAVTAASFHALVSLAVWLLAFTWLFGLPHPTALLLPVVLLPLFLLVLGLSWALAAFGVFLRDISQLIGLVVTMLMFLSPVFYPVSSLPEPWRGLIGLNPLTPAVEQTRQVLYWGVAPDPVAWLLQLALSLVAAWAGFAWFQRSRTEFADLM